MPAYLEELEPRTLFAATPTQAITLTGDVTRLSGDVKTIRADMRACQVTSNRDLAALNAALGKNKTATDRSLLSAFRTDVRNAFGLLSRHFGSVQGATTRDVRRVLADDVKLLRKPGDTATRTRRDADLATLRTDAALLTLAADAGAVRTAANADLTAIGVAHTTDTAVQTAVATARANANACVTTLSADQTKVQSDLATYEADAAAV